MTAAELLTAARAAGLELIPIEGDRLVARPKDALTDEIRAALREHKDRLVAVLKLREIHTAMGFSPEDVALLERVYLDPDDDREIVIAVRPPEGAVA